MAILLILASLAVVIVMAIVHFENRQDYFRALDNYHKGMGFRHHMDPKATIEDIEKYIKAITPSRRGR